MDTPNPKVKNKGVQILLNRMDSHPEEFTYSGGAGFKMKRWAWVMDTIINRVHYRHKPHDSYKVGFPFLTDDEVDVIYDKYMELQGDEFTQSIMRELLNDKYMDEGPNIVSNLTIPSGGIAIRSPNTMNSIANVTNTTMNSIAPVMTVTRKKE